MQQPGNSDTSHKRDRRHETEKLLEETEKPCYEGVVHRPQVVPLFKILNIP
jgi:hypothetical protein